MLIMTTTRNYLLIFLICYQVFNTVYTQSTKARGSGQTDNKPIFINNYIPASMHVIFHLTDLMKYEIRPGVSDSSTTTTVRPTPPHKPGYYAPEVPPGPAAYFARSTFDSPPEEEYRRLDTTNTRALSDFHLQPKRHQQQALPDDLDLFGAAPNDLLHQINVLEDVDVIGEDDDDQIYKFSLNYEDSVNLDYLRKKRVPPTRAYVTLLSLYDTLNKEAKELGLNKFNGYSDTILNELIKTSEGSSADQLKFVLSKVIEKRNTRKMNIINKIKTILNDLEKPSSYISEALRYIPPFQFSA